jgi:biopolymer transport protein ExbD
MAGSQNIGESSDNPVAINVTAMVDVIFCLCLFFMCSFHFKQLEGKIETWLPKDTGISHDAPPETNPLQDIRLVLQWDAAARRTQYRVNDRPAAPDDAALMRDVTDMAAEYYKLGKKDFPIILEASREVPWKDVMHVMDLCKEKNLQKIQFSGSSSIGATMPRSS